jgi:hypothetical protein
LVLLSSQLFAVARCPCAFFSNSLAMLHPLF